MFSYGFFFHVGKGTSHWFSQTTSLCIMCVFFCMFVPGVRSWLKLFGKTGSRFEGRSISDNSCPSPDLLRSFLMSLTAQLLISSLHWSPGECVQNMYRLKKNKLKLSLGCTYEHQQRDEAFDLQWRIALYYTYIHTLVSNYKKQCQVWLTHGPTKLVVFQVKVDRSTSTIPSCSY